MCMCVFIHVCECRHVLAMAHMWRPEDNLGVALQTLSLRSFGTGGLSDLGLTNQARLVYQ